MARAKQAVGILSYLRALGDDVQLQLISPASVGWCYRSQAERALRLADMQQSTAYEKSVLLSECEDRLARAHTRFDLASPVSKASSPVTTLRAVAKKAGRVPKVARGSYQVEELQMKLWAGSWESVSVRSSGVGQLSSVASEALLSEEMRQPELAESGDAVDELLPAGDPGAADIWGDKRPAIDSHLGSLRARREEAMQRIKCEAREEHALARRAFRSHDWAGSINHLNSALGKAHSEPLLRLRARATLRSEATRMLEDAAAASANAPRRADNYRLLAVAHTRQHTWQGRAEAGRAYLQGMDLAPAESCYHSGSEAASHGASIAGGRDNNEPVRLEKQRMPRRRTPAAAPTSCRRPSLVAAQAKREQGLDESVAASAPIVRVANTAAPFAGFQQLLHAIQRERRYPV